MGVFQQFPYSNFHEFNLDQIIKIMREMQDEWEATKSEWASYKEFIDNYFENLDVSEEVLEALRIFAYDGTLAAVVDPTIATTTSAWLSAHIGPTTPAIDNTFTVNGAGADSGMVGRTILHYKNTAPAEYNSLLANITLPLIFIVGNGAAWSDKPTSVGIFKNEVYYATATETSCIQTFYTYPELVSYRRMVVGTNPAGNWIRSDTNAVTCIPINGNSASYDRLLAKVGINTICPLTVANWDDLPTGEPNTVFILTNQTYDGSHYVQNLLAYPSLRTYTRLVEPSTGTVNVPWRLQTHTAGFYINYSAIGDSITAGCYSNDQGEGVVVTNAEWSYPTQMMQRYGCINHNHGVPGAKLTQMLPQAQAIVTNSDLVTIMGGVNDYLQGTPLGTVGSPDLTTCAGSLATLIETCANRAPNARIVLVSPMLINRGDASTNYSANYRLSSFTMEELNTVYKQTAEFYNVEFIDGLHTSPVNFKNITNVLKDGEHPTIDFYRSVSNWIGSKLF